MVRPKDKKYKVSKNLPDYSHMPQRLQQELLHSWHMSGGVINAKRYNRCELAAMLGITEPALEKRLVTARSMAIKAFEDVNSVRELVFEITYKTIQQLQSDRSKAELHAQIIENQMVYATEQLEAAKEMPEKSEKQRREKRGEINRWINIIKNFSFHHSHAIAACGTTVDNTVKFLGLFSSTDKEKGGLNNKKSLANIIPVDDPKDSPENETTYLDQRRALEILEAHEGSRLPKQMSNKLTNDPRNPGVGFEELAHQEPADSEE